MDLTTARAAIETAFAKMAEGYRRPVFDEWALLDIAGTAETILHYSGPRVEDFQQHLAEDLRLLRAALMEGNQGPGDFEFAREGKGEMIDAFLVVGDQRVLVCNHTGKSMDDITTDPLWAAAQGPFVDLSEKFRANPLG